MELVGRCRGVASRQPSEVLTFDSVPNPDMLMSGLTLVDRQIPVETGFVDLVGIDEPFWPSGPARTASSA